MHPDATDNYRMMWQMFQIAFVATALSWGPVAQASPTCGPRLHGWDQSRVDSAQQVNTVILYDRHHHSPTWNGAPVNADQVRQYLEVTKQMSPQPIFVLIISPNADCHEVDTYRRMASDILKCAPGRCVEAKP
jgi:hypothetical protein